MNNVTRKAKDLRVGDVFRLHVYGIVTGAFSVANGKRVRIKIELEDQGRASVGKLEAVFAFAGREDATVGPAEFSTSTLTTTMMTGETATTNPLAPLRLSLLARSVDE